MHYRFVLILAGLIVWTGCTSGLQVNHHSLPILAGPGGFDVTSSGNPHASHRKAAALAAGKGTRNLLAEGQTIVRNIAHNQERGVAPRNEILLATAIEDVTASPNVSAPQPLLLDAQDPLMAPVVGPSEFGIEATLPQLLELALAQHPRLQVRENEVRVARAAVLTAATRDNPQFVMDTDTPVNESGPTQLGFRLTFPIHTAGKLQRRQMAAMAGVRRAWVERGVDESLLMLEVVDAASEVLYLQELLTLQQRLQAIAEERAKLVAEETEFDPDAADNRIVKPINAEVAAWQEQSRQLDTQRALTSAKSVLTRALGVSPDTELRLNDDLSMDSAALISLEEVVALARDRSPEFAAADSALEETRQRHALAFAEAVPDIELGPRYQDELDDDGTDSIGIRFETDVPVFDKNQGEIAGTGAQMAVDASNARLAEHNATNDAAEQYRELLRIRENWQSLGASTAAMQSRYQQQLNDPGVRRIVPGSEIASIRQQLLQFQIVALEMRYRFFRASRRLEVLLGQSIFLSSPG